ncbi:MAG: hypothetical protein R6V25_00100 [Desulfatiglandales bacterium]
MVFFANLGVNLRGCLCGVLQYASAQPLDFLDLDKKSSFLNWKLASAQKAFLDGHEYRKLPGDVSSALGRVSVRDIFSAFAHAAQAPALQGRTWARSLMNSMNIMLRRYVTSRPGRIVSIQKRLFRDPGLTRGAPCGGG